MSFLPWTEPTNGAHPRVWFKATGGSAGTPDVATLVTRKNTTHSAYWNELKTYADQHLNTGNYPNSWYDNRDGEYTGAIAFYYRLDTTKTSHAARARDIALYLATKTIPSGSTKRDWLVAMTQTYDWLYSFLTSSQRSTIRNRITQYVESMRQFKDGEYIWGTSHGDMVFAAFALCAIMGDGTSAQNTTWRGWFDELMDNFDDGDGNGFWPVFRHFGNSENGTHKGSGSWSYMNVQENFYSTLFPALKSAVGFDWRTDGGPEAWWENTMHWQLWHVRRGNEDEDGDLTTTFHREHECRGLSFFSIYPMAHALQISDINSSTLGRHSLWLADLIEESEAPTFGPWNIYQILWRNPARTPLEPTIANTGGNEMMTFPRSGKVVFRSSTPDGDAWDENSISAVLHWPKYHTEGHQQRRAGAFQMAGYGSRLWFEHGHYDSATNLVPKQSSTGANTGHRWSYYARIIAACGLSIRHSQEKAQNEVDSCRRQIPASSTFGVQSGSSVIFSNCGDQLWPKNTAKNDYLANSLDELLDEPKWVKVGLVFEDEPGGGDFAYAVADLTREWWSGKVTRHRQHALWIKRGVIPGWTHGAVLVLWDDLVVVQDSAFGKKQVLALLQSNLQATGAAADLRFDSADGSCRGWCVTGGPAVEVEHVSGFKDLDGVTYPASSTDSRDDSNEGVWRAQLNPAVAASAVSMARALFLGPAGTASHPAVTNIDDATWRGITIGGVEIKMRKGTTFQASVAGAGGSTGTTSTSISTSTVSTITTSTISTTTVSTQSTTTPPGVTLPTIEGPFPAVMPQRNPTADKPAARLSLAGSTAESPMIAGLAASLRLGVGEGEELHRWRIFSDNGFEKELVWELQPDQEDEDPQVPDAVTTIVLGVDTDTGPESVRNYVEWETSRGITRRQFWVRNPPETGGLYAGNQECQSGTAVFTLDPGEDLTFGISILPEVNDEFFNASEYDGNRFANTLRMWGGAATAEVLIDGDVVIGERDVADIDGFFWSAPSVGDHDIKVVLRAARASIYKVELEGQIRVEAAA